MVMKIVVIVCPVDFHCFMINCSYHHSLHKSRIKVDSIVESGGLRLDLVRDDGLLV